MRVLLDTGGLFLYTNPMQKLLIQEFISSHPDWERILLEKPYCLNIQRDSKFGRNFLLFKYDQIDSDFSIPLVRECRGLILDADTLEPVCVPFFKFFNAEEKHADEIDWKTAWSSEKLDGSLTKVVRLGNDLLVSTNGTIDAYKAPIQDQIGFVGKTFGDLFEMAVANAKDRYDRISLENHYAREDWHLPPMDWFRNLLQEGHTYMFELTSRYNHIVVKFGDPEIHLIGIRDNRTFREIEFFNHPLSRFFHTPELFRLGTLKEVEEAAERLDADHEGFVVCDGDFRRVKVKSTTYCHLHHLRGEGGTPSFERGIEIVRKNELDEVLAYFPEFREHLERIKSDLDDLVERLESEWLKFSCVRHYLKTRKEQALAILSEEGFGKKFSGVGFSLLDGRVSSVREWIEKCPAKNLVKYLGYKEDKVEN